MLIHYTKYHAIFKLLRLDKPVGILLLLYPCVLALIAGFDFKMSQIPISLWFVFIIGSILMRSAGCAINDFFDQDIDKYVQRTKNRPLVMGYIHSKTALIITFALVLLSALLLFFLPLQSYIFIGIALLLALTYPLAKRWLPIPQSYLALTFSMSMPVAYFSNPAKMIDSFSIYAIILLMCANFFWVLSYDTFYAMVDKKDDQHLNIKSAALYFGRYDYRFAWLFYAISLVLFYLFAWKYAPNFSLQLSNNLLQTIVFLAICSIFIYHSNHLFQLWVVQKANILKDDDLAKEARAFCFKVFYQQKYMGALYVLLYIFST